MELCEPRYDVGVDDDEEQDGKADGEVGGVGWPAVAACEKCGEDHQHGEVDEVERVGEARQCAAGLLVPLAAGRLAGAEQDVKQDKGGDAEEVVGGEPCGVMSGNGGEEGSIEREGEPAHPVGGAPDGEDSEQCAQKPYSQQEDDAAYGIAETEA